MTDTPEMVDRVARAIWRVSNPEGGGFSEVAPDDWDAWPDSAKAASLAQVEHSRNDYRDQAIAAITAMLEPPDAVLAASWSAPNSPFRAIELGRISGIKSIWRAMIYAALGMPA